MKLKKSIAENVIRWTSKITFSLKGTICQICSSHLSRFRNIIRSYWYTEKKKYQNWSSIGCFFISILIPYVAISYSYFRTYDIDIFEHVNFVFFIPD